ncbi:MAG: hypothetical protein ABEJ23_00895 [Haloarculaceae archaeon]
MALVDDLSAALGDSLRVVAVADFDAGEYDVQYIRPDVRSQYSEADVERIYQDVGVSGFAKEIQDELYEPIGEAEGSIDVFENGINVVRWNEDGAQAIFVGLVRDLDAATTAFEQTASVFPVEV